MVAPFLPDEEKVAAIRKELPATGAGVYLDAATAGPLPAETDRAMREWADWELRVGRAGPDADAEFRARFDEARGTLAAILVAPAERVGLAPSVGLALRIAAGSRQWRPGERIVVASSLERPVLVSLAELAATVGADLETVDLAEEGGSGAPAEGIGPAAEALRGPLGAGAVLVVAPHVSPHDGSILPVAQLAEAVHRAGAWLAVDGSFAVGAVPVDAPSLGADIYATAGDRWLCGPSGTAAVYVGPWLTMPSTLTGGDGAGPEAGFHRAAVVGLGRSAGWLAMQVGLDWAYSRARHLVELAADLLRAIPGVTILAPPDRVGALLAVHVDGWPADRLREELGRRAFAIVGLVESAEALRMSIGFWNTEDEIRRFAEALAELTTTTPERVARRPPIAIVPAERSRA